MIYILHVTVPQSVLNLASRTSVFEHLRQKHPESILSGESEQNLEEILVDLAGNEVLCLHEDYATEYHGFRRMKQEPLVINYRDFDSVRDSPKKSQKCCATSCNKDDTQSDLPDSASLVMSNMDIDFSVNDELQSELQQMAPFELNLMLYFIYRSAIKFGIAEFDVL